MRYSAVLAVVLVASLAGCLGKALPPVAVKIPARPIHYQKEVKPILDKRCAVCHSCYNSPCQLKIDSFEGVDRGATKRAVYNASRLSSMDPTRLFIDAQTTREWREKQFFTVTESSVSDGLNDSIMIQMLYQKMNNPKSSGEYRPETDELTCSEDRMSAAISPQAMGGGLFDSEGRLVGLTTRFEEGVHSINFAMPVEWIREIKPGVQRVSERRGEVEWLKRAAFLVNFSDWGGLQEWCREWAAAKPASAASFFFLGIAHRNLQQHADAVLAFQQAISIDPNSAVVWHNLGITYSRLKRHDDAIESYRQALLIEPDFTDALINLGVTYTLTGNQTEAMEVARELRRFDPFSADVLQRMTISH